MTEWQAAAGNAVLRFTADWRVEQEGEIRQGGRVLIDYDTRRLDALDGCRGLRGFEVWHGAPVWHLEAEVAFHPRGHTSVAVVDPWSASSRPASVAVPLDAERMAVWFHEWMRAGGRGCDDWDSRYGANYRYRVTPAGSTPAVAYRSNAVTSELDLRGMSAEAVKRRCALDPGLQLETCLRLVVSVRNRAYEKRVWLDLHGFDAAGSLVMAATRPARYVPSTTGCRDTFAFAECVHRGCGATPGAVWNAPDVRVLQYRLYCAMAGTTYTDGLLHQLTVPSDNSVLQDFRA